MNRLDERGSPCPTYLVIGKKLATSVVRYDTFDICLYRPLSRFRHLGLKTKLDGQTKLPVHSNMAHDHCCILLCKNDKSNENGSNLSFFNFPTDEKRKGQWVVFIKRDEGKYFVVS